jgi:hypothetical protein
MKSTTSFHTLGLLLGLASANPAQALELARVFGNNMVLQRSPHTVLWGSGGTNHMPVWVQYRRATWQTNADTKGDWRILLDLTKPTFGPPDTLTVGVGKKGKGPVLSLQNVAVGRVWLLTDWQSQSVRLASVLKLTDAQNRIRFLDLANPAHEPGWGMYDSLVQTLGANAFSIYLARALAESGYAGIIQTTPQELQGNLNPAHVSKLLQAGPCATNALQLANNEVRLYETNRFSRFVESKHEGKVENIPQAFNYSLPLIYPPEAFSSDRPPTGWLTFEAAIWPGAAQNH